MPSIKERRVEIQGRLREHDAARKLIEAELLALQHVCPHVDAKTTHSNTWGRCESTDWDCPDCGLHR